MEITRLMCNHLIEPIGFACDITTFSWLSICEGKRQLAAQVVIGLDAEFTQVIHDSGKRDDISSVAYSPELDLKPRTRYYWKVHVWSDNGEEASATSWFETGKMNEAMYGKWIASSLDKDITPIIRKCFKAKDVKEGKLYICGLGTYEIYLNGQKVSDDVLAPGHHSYDLWLQIFTYDISEYLEENNELCVLLTKGWYKGRFGFDGGFTNIYGDTLRLIADISLLKNDGKEEILGSDSSWECKPSAIVDSGIYLGEEYDERINDIQEVWSPVIYVENDLGELHDRYSPHLRVMERLKPIEILHTDKDEYILDFGQNMAGWVEFDVHALPYGTKITLSYSEVLQDGVFYRENLRTAEARHIYVSNGTDKHVRPHGTYFGFRYVMVEGVIPCIENFVACALYSNIEQSGFIKTDNPKLNRLFANALWGQKSNFIDVPTDCPQRDERMGWTGDAQIFAGTACFNMYTPAFYAKYMEDLSREQQVLKGGIPFVIPVIKPKYKSGIGNADMLSQGHSSCAWGDVATILPWTLYRYYGDRALLSKHYPAMKAWVDYIKKQDEDNGGKRLWLTGFHFADWLALDNYQEPDSPIGGTDSYYVASCYYYYSTEIVAKASKVLSKEEEYNYYHSLQEEIRMAILNEYFTPNGKCAINTQTARVVALHFGIVPETFKKRQLAELKAAIELPMLPPQFGGDGKRKVALKTGFVGTPYLCPVLANNGDIEDAYSLLLKEDYPSWLYEVNMGATTVWERWNSILPDGHISGTGMNSLNHYSYGSIVEWLYRYAGGLNEIEPGFKRVLFKPLRDPLNRLNTIQVQYNSASGTYTCGYHRQGKTYVYNLTVPFDCIAEVILPNGVKEVVDSGTYEFIEEILDD